MLHDIIGAIFSGGATGLFGSIINSVGDYFKMREKYRHDEALAKIEIQTMKMEADRDIAVAKQSAMAVMETAAANTLTASYTADARSYLPAAAIKTHTGISWLMAIVDFVRGLVRPFLTLFLTIITFRLYLNTRAILDSTQGFVSPDQALDLIRTIILGILYLTFTAVGWWFGSRSRFDKILK